MVIKIVDYKQLWIQIIDMASVLIGVTKGGGNNPPPPSVVMVPKITSVGTRDMVKLSLALNRQLRRI